MVQKRKLEDYMKTILNLQSLGPVHSVDIAERLGVSKAVVSKSIDSLEEEGYLRRLEDRTIELLPKGMVIAKDVVSRHEGIYGLLVSLGVEEETAKRDACSMEHAVSSESFCALMSLASKKEA